MVSNKVNKYMNKYQERNYAPKERKLEKSDLGKYRDRSETWETSEASCGDCLLESWEEQEEKVTMELIMESYGNIPDNEEYIEEEKMKASEKKTLLKHIKKDDKEFRAQIKEDVKLKKQILKSKDKK